MGLEDEFIDIEDLDIATEIKIGDFILLETTNGTKLIDFKDFIIGVDNITFFDKISGNYLQFADVSAISAKAITNESILSSISGVNEDVNNLTTRINAVEDSLVSFVNSISTTSISDSDISNFTNGRVGFTVTNTTDKDLTASIGKVQFASLSFRGSALTEGTDIALGTGSDGFFYKALGSYGMLFNGSITIKSNFVIGQPVSLNILKNGTIISSNVVTNVQRVERNLSSGSFNFSTYINVSEGDLITLSFSDARARIGVSTFSGIRLA